MKFDCSQLFKYRGLKLDLLTLEELINECNQLAYSISVMSLYRDRVKVKNKVDMIQKTLLRCDKLKECYILKVKECVKCMEGINCVLNRVSDSECRRVLKLLYIDGLSAEVAAEKMNISYKTLYRYRKRAFDELKITAL